MLSKPVWVLDTNVLLDWLIFNDADVRPLTEWIITGRVRLITRMDCREEFIRVLAYPALKAMPLQREQALLTYDQWHAPLQQASGIGWPVRTLPQCSDADDQKFLELAWAGKADWLITRDKALLKLGRTAQQSGLFRILDVNAASRDLTSR